MSHTAVRKAFARHVTGWVRHSQPTVLTASMCSRRALVSLAVLLGCGLGSAVAEVCSETDDTIIYCSAPDYCCGNNNCCSHHSSFSIYGGTGFLIFLVVSIWRLTALCRNRRLTESQRPATIVIERNIQEAQPPTEGNREEHLPPPYHIALTNKTIPESNIVPPSNVPYRNLETS